MRIKFDSDAKIVPPAQVAWAFPFPTSEKLGQGGFVIFTYGQAWAIHAPQDRVNNAQL